MSRTSPPDLTHYAGSSLHVLARKGGMEAFKIAGNELPSTDDPRIREIPGPAPEPIGSGQLVPFAVLLFDQSRFQPGTLTRISSAPVS
jgi:hypothetical protein